jgi:hypothetical protein
MKIAKTIMAAIGIAVALGLCVNAVGRLAYARAWIDIDVRDEHGHGPDRGQEWDRAARIRITRTAVLSGFVCCPVVVILLLSRRSLKGGQPAGRASSAGKVSLPRGKRPG